MYKKLRIIICFLLYGVSVSAQDNVIDEVIWVVGDEPILKSEVENRRKDFIMSDMELDGDPYCIIPEQIALEKLYLHQAKLDSIAISDSEIIQEAERRINYIVSQIGSVERMEEYFQKDYATIKEEMRRSAENSLIISTIQRNIVEKVKVTPAEVRRYFNKLPQDSIPFIPTEVEVQILIMQPTISQEEIDNIKTRLRGYAERVNNGEAEFSTLAVLYSEDGSARRGGELGFKGKGEFVPEFSAVAFNLQNTNRVSKIVETEFGFHIIQLIEKRGDRINCRHILLKPRPSITEQQAALNRLDSIAQAIRNNEITFENAVSYYSTDKYTRNNRGMMANNMNGMSVISTSRFKMDELPAEVAKAVSTLEVGAISAPFTMIDAKTNKEVTAIVKLKNRIDAHKANTSDDFQMLKETYENLKREELLAKWIKEKQKSTYVRINKKWRNCEFKYDGWVIND